MTGFEYVLPVIRGIQAEQEYYVTMCPLGILPKLFPLPNQTLDPQQRSQRRVNKGRITKITNYILENPQDYVFGAITATIDADITFEPLGEVAEERKLGRLRIPMEGSLTIHDGLHRRVALEVALRENPGLRYETIAVVLFIETGLRKSQQIFCDLNRWGVTLPSSLTILYDHRDDYSVVTQAIVEQVSILKRLVYLEGNTIPKSSDKLFTLNYLYQGTVELLRQFSAKSLEDKVNLGVSFWQAVSLYMIDWEKFIQGRLAVEYLRNDYLSGQGMILTALGTVGGLLLESYPHTWQQKLQGLTQVNWLLSETSINLETIMTYLQPYLDLREKG